MRWLAHMLMHRPETLLNLLMEARKIDREKTLASNCFRAGLKIGRKYPDIADEVLQDQAPEWNI